MVVVEVAEGQNPRKYWNMLVFRKFHKLSVCGVLSCNLLIRFFLFGLNNNLVILGPGIRILDLSSRS